MKKSKKVDAKLLNRQMAYDQYIVDTEKTKGASAAMMYRNANKRPGSRNLRSH